MIRASNSTPLEETVDENALFTEMMQRVQDAQQERRKYESQWQDNTKLVIGDHSEVFDTGSHKYFVVNRVRQVVDTHTAVMTENPARLTYEPSEVGEPADWLLKPESAGKVQQAEQIAGQPLLAPEQRAGEAFIDEPTAQMLLSITETEQQAVTTDQEDEEGEPVVSQVDQDIPILTEEDFHVIDNQLEAELLTREVQGQWRGLANADATAVTNVFESQVVGHCDLLPQWNAEDDHFTLSNLYPYSVWIDPWAQDTSDAEYYIVLEMMPISEAKSIWPQFSEYIERNAGMPGSHSGHVADGMSERMRAAGMRKVIAVRTWWQRNHPYERTPEGAVEMGLVQPAMDVQETEARDPETGEMLIDPETETPLIEQSEVEAVDPETNQQLYQLEDGTRVQPGDELWPKRYGIRQVQFIHTKLVFDQETEFADIPAGRTKCMMIPKSPHAQGEPQRLAELNDLYNHLHSIYYGYFRKFRSPQQVVPKSVYDATAEMVERVHSDSGLKWIIPDHLVNQYGANIMMNLDPPQLGTVISEMMTRIDAEIDKISGLSDVLRGETKSDQSGELFRQALEAARGPIGLKARNFSQTLRHVGKVIAHLVIDYMDPEVWAQRNTKYPPIVFERIKERMARHGVNVVAEVSGAGTREERIRQLQELWGMGVQTPTILRDMLDQTGVSDGQKIVEEWQQMMMAQQEPQ